jgi:hypothetical protein
MKDDAIEIFNDATFTLHKWHSNKRELDETTGDNEEKTFAKQQLGTPSEGEASILGLAWSEEKDELKVVVPSGEVTTTKRRRYRGMLRYLLSKRMIGSNGRSNCQTT